MNPVSLLFVFESSECLKEHGLVTNRCQLNFVARVVLICTLLRRLHEAVRIDMQQLNLISVFHKLSSSHGEHSLVLSFLFFQFSVQLLQLFFVVFHVTFHACIHGFYFCLVLVCHVSEENSAIFLLAVHLFIFLGIFLSFIRDSLLFLLGLLVF
jgi:hypothetical protein